MSFALSRGVSAMVVAAMPFILTAASPANESENSPPPLSLPPDVAVEDIVSSTSVSRALPSLAVSPPLGLGDADLLLGNVEALLDSLASTPTLSLQKRAVVSLEEAGRYFDGIARASQGKIRYRWVSVGKKRVGETGDGPDTIDRDSYKIGSVDEDAMAVRFQAIEGDVYVKDLTVRSVEGDTAIYAVGRWIRWDLPLREVYYFDRPVRVKKISLNLRRKSERPPRLAVELGIPRRPEFARIIAALCRKTVEDLWAERIDTARANIAEARRRLAQLQLSI